MTSDSSTLISGGLIVDGTGNEPYPGSVQIIGDRITAVLAADDPAPAADRVVDAYGRVISPGFIDLHSHADFTAQSSPGARTQLHQGVTTLLTGNCGFSPFPVIDRDALVAATAFLGDELDWSWTDVAGFAGVHDHQGLAINLALQVGHHALRLAAMGADQRAPTRAELDRMRALLARAAEQGAYGFSTGLIYAPGCYADPAELTELAAEAGRAGLLYSTHIRNEGSRLLEAIDEAVTAARAGGTRLQISHLKAAGPAHHGSIGRALELIEQARAGGVDVGCDVYPYDASSTTLTTRLPNRALAGGIPALLQRLADPDQRQRLRAELAAQNGQLSADLVTLASGPEAARTLADVAADRGVDPAEATLQLLEENAGAVSVINRSMAAEDVATALRHPLSSVSSDGWILSGPEDAGWRRGHPHPRNFGTFPRVLGHYCREAGLFGAGPRGLAETVRKMTSLPASRLQLTDRGVLRSGAIADVVVFDPGAIADRSRYVDPWQLATGVTDVLVSGTPVLTSGEPTGDRPGRVLRRTG